MLSNAIGWADLMRARVAWHRLSTLPLRAGKWLVLDHMELCLLRLSVSIEVCIVCSCARFQWTWPLSVAD